MSSINNIIGIDIKDYEYRPKRFGMKVIVEISVTLTAFGMCSETTSYLDSQDLSDQFGILPNTIEDIGKNYNFTCGKVRVDPNKENIYNDFNRPIFKTEEDCNRFIEFLGTLAVYKQLDQE